MPHEPKKRHSKARQGKRRNSIKVAVSEAVRCENCDKFILSHAVCENCGFYKGKEIIKSRSRKKEEKKKKAKEEESSPAGQKNTA